MLPAKLNKIELLVLFDPRVLYNFQLEHEGKQTSPGHWKLCYLNTYICMYICM